MSFFAKVSMNDAFDVYVGYRNKLLTKITFS